MVVRFGLLPKSALRTAGVQSVPAVDGSGAGPLKVLERPLQNWKSPSGVNLGTPGVCKASELLSEPGRVRKSAESSTRAVAMSIRRNAELCISPLPLGLLLASIPRLLLYDCAAPPPRVCASLGRI